MRTSVLSEEVLHRYPVAVLGFGRAGHTVCDYLLGIGCRPTVYETGEISEKEKSRYTANGVSFVGDFPTEFPQSILFRSPGIRPDHPAILRSQARGAYLTGEVDWFLSHTSATVIGVTGSDGKTTTSALIAQILQTAGKRVICGGNNGGALLPHLSALGEGDFAVVELSSFQLATASAPDVAVITNLTPNHLNWHKDYFEYLATKCRIFRGASRLVLSADCPASVMIGSRAPIPITWHTVREEMPFTPETGVVSLTVAGENICLHGEQSVCKIPAFRDFMLPGTHNRQNMLAAYAAAYPFVNERAVLAVSRNFRGVPHRLQHIGCINGVTYINSSIDTSPTRTAAALSAMEMSPIVIAGGRTKGIPLDTLGDTLSARAKAVFLYGEAATEIEDAVDGRVYAEKFDLFADAFAAASCYARAGDAVLLSPGCTAYDQFENFEKRGECFAELVKALAGKDKKSGTSRADSRDGGTCECNGL